jgi:tetratricopeptide (TPR) repeat protein
MTKASRAREALAIFRTYQPDSHFSVRAALDQLTVVVARARASTLRSQWEQAALSYSKVVDAFPLGDISFEHACLRLIVGDDKAYEEFCTRLAADETLAHDPSKAYLAARICSLHPSSGVPSNHLLDWAKRAIASDPKKAQYRHALGAAYYRCGEFQDAVWELDGANKGDSSDSGKAQNWLFLAMAHHRLGNIETAQQWLSKAGKHIDGLTQLPSVGVMGVEPVDWLGLQVLRREADNALVIPAIQKDIEFDSTNADAHYDLGRTLFGQMKLPEAIAAFQKAIELCPEKAELHKALGLALARNKKLNEAIACFRKSIELDPKYIHAHTDLGIALYEQKKLDEAIVCFRMAIEVDPKSALAHYYLGNVLRDQRTLDAALDEYREAFRLDPRMTDARFISALNNQAWTLATDADLGKRDPAQALKMAQAAVELGSRLRSTWNTLGAAQYRAGHWQAALRALNKSMELTKGGDSFDWFFLAMAHWQLGEKDKARDWYDRAAQWMDKNQPTNAELLRFRAEAAELLAVENNKN